MYHGSRPVLAAIRARLLYEQRMWSMVNLHDIALAARRRGTRTGRWSVRMVVAAICATIPVFAATGCAVATPMASTSIRLSHGGGSSTDVVSMTSMTFPATGLSGGLSVVTSQPVVQEASSSELSFPDTNTVLTPVKEIPSYVVSAAVAYQTLERDGTIYASSSELDGPFKASLYQYYNSAHGVIQPDGSVTLDYQGTLVWAFVARLNSSFVPEVVYPYRGPSDTFYSEPTSSRKCTYLALLNARTGESITAGPECTG